MFIVKTLNSYLENVIIYLNFENSGYLINSTDLMYEESFKIVF